MKNQIIYTMLTMLAFTGSISAASKDYKGEIKVEQTEFAQKGNKLVVGMKVKLEDVDLANKRGVDIIPMVVSNSNSTTLPKVSIKSSNNYKAYKRSLALMSKAQKSDYVEPYTVLKASGDMNETIEYTYTMPYEKWMDNARLEIQRDDCGCGSQPAGPAEIIASSVSRNMMKAEYKINPVLAFITPETESVKSREAQTEVALDFAVSKTDIRPNYMNNPAELAKIDRMISSIRSDKGVDVKSINITGFASPEGTLDYNKTLSEGRANALKNYILGKYNFPKDIISVEFGGENWDGLVEALQSYDMKYKDEVLDIINTVSIEGGREKQLMDLRGGVPYNDLLKNVFPSLRIALCKVKYNVKSFDVAEAKELISTRPQNLSLEEMYMVANTYDKKSAEFADVFETAARMFPEDVTASINAACAALTRGDVTSAEKYLGRVKTKSRIPEYDNAMGVLEMYKGNLDKAESYLNAAKQAGVEEAVKNLAELQAKRDNK